jgi:hypothetical protein
MMEFGLNPSPIGESVVNLQFVLKASDFISHVFNDGAGLGLVTFQGMGNAHLSQGLQDSGPLPFRLQQTDSRLGLCHD